MLAVAVAAVRTLLQPLQAGALGAVATVQQHLLPLATVQQTSVPVAVEAEILAVQQALVVMAVLVSLFSLFLQQITVG
jgi:hypothetical protein